MSLGEDIRVAVKYMCLLSMREKRAKNKNSVSANKRTWKL